MTDAGRKELAQRRVRDREHAGASLGGQELARQEGGSSLMPQTQTVLGVDDHARRSRPAHARLPDSEASDAVVDGLVLSQADMPGDLLSQARRQIRCGVPTQPFLRQVDASGRALHVTTTLAVTLDGHLVERKQLLEVGDERSNVHGVATGDVEDGRQGQISRQGADRGIDDIPHVGVVPDLAAVSEDGDGSPVEQRLDEAVSRHIGSLPRAVHREVAQRHRRDAE